jgi:hypothetical protein
VVNLEITLVSTADGEWEMLFFDNELEHDGHSIYSTDLLRLMNQYLPETITKIEIKELTWEAMEKYDCEFPKFLSVFDEEDFI